MLEYPTLASHVRPSKPLSERLREATHVDHARTKKHPLMAGLVAGSIDHAGYAGYLGQLLHVHTTLGAALRDGAERHYSVFVVAREHHFREPALRADLEALGEPPERTAPLPATGLFCERINGLAAEAPQALLGTLYVLEGSTNGGCLIAPAVRRALGLPEGVRAGPGTVCLDPHGPNQRHKWSFFKKCIDVLTLAPADHDLIVAVAIDAFRGVYDILEDLTHPPNPPRVSVLPPRWAEKEAGTHPTP